MTSDAREVYLKLLFHSFGHIDAYDGAKKKTLQGYFKEAM